MMGELHDFGKISPLFAQVLTGHRRHINHALPGAFVAKQVFDRCKAPVTARMMSMAIAGHHGELRDRAIVDSWLRQCGEHGAGEDERGNAISLVGQTAYSEALAYWTRWFSFKRVEDPPRFAATDAPKIAEMLFARMLYSALIDADWSGSAEHFDPNYLSAHSGPPLDSAAVLSRLLDLREKKRSRSTATSALNAMRDNLFESCLSAGMSEPGLFTLTAPTGLGKTLSLFAFAVNHCRLHNKRRIILVLPYLSIIEQNSRDYRRLVPNLLEVHSHTNWTEENAAAAERWDTACIVTTNVSFFEPLFSAKAGKCRHLHLLSNSVIVLDEAQSLPPHLLEATLQTIRCLCEQYGCTFVMSTATQPSFAHIAALNGRWAPREIVPHPQELFNATRRVTVDWQVDRPTAWEDVAEQCAQLPQVCLIVNLKRHARQLLAHLSARRDPQEVYFLTADLCPAHRTDVLETVTRRLQAREPCVLVATQCIEAGVDLDFPAVWRALAPLESLIQAAGRCNRNGDAPDGQVTIFVPDEPEHLYPSEEYGRAANCVKTLLARHPVDFANLTHIDEYYQLYFSTERQDSVKLSEAIEEFDYQETEAQYRFIGQAGVQVIVPYAPLMEQFEALRARHDREGLTSELLRAARELTVTTYETSNLCKVAEPLRVRRGRDFIQTDYYLLGDPSCYDERQGLQFDVPFDGIL